MQSGITYTLGSNLENLILTGTSAVNGTGNTLDNLVRGNSANNTLGGAGGFDALEGMGGNDTLSDTSGANYFNGGAGTDAITGGAGNEFFIGGAGNDTLTTGSGRDLIAFNKGDGQDIINASSTQDNTLSLGGGILYADLQLRKSSNNLILDTGASESITLKDWYLSGSNKSVLNLQMVAEAMADFDANSGDPLRNKKVTQFNFDGMVNAFDQARAANPGLTSWALTNALTQFQLGGSDTAALGGDLAYYYGKNGTVAGINFTAAQSEISSAQFGAQNQTLQPLASLQGGGSRPRIRS